MIDEPVPDENPPADDPPSYDLMSLMGALECSARRQKERWSELEQLLRQLEEEPDCATVLRVSGLEPSPLFGGLQIGLAPYDLATDDEKRRARNALQEVVNRLYNEHFVEITDPVGLLSMLTGGIFPPPDLGRFEPQPTP